MFTGIVEEMGTVVSLNECEDMVLWDGTQRAGYELIVQSNDGIVMDGIYNGCSICVSGVCLTVTSYDAMTQQFHCGIAPETFARTYFTSLTSDMLVNLERAAAIGGRNSGHTVQGHVDCTGTIVSKVVEGNSLKMTIRVNDASILPYIVPKGFIAIDGTSLTVIDVNADEKTFTFMLIEYTQKHIIVPAKTVHDLVNIEVDVMAKYAANAASSSMDTPSSSLLQRIDSLEGKVKELEAMFVMYVSEGRMKTLPPRTPPPFLKWTIESLPNQKALDTTNGYIDPMDPLALFSQPTIDRHMRAHQKMTPIECPPTTMPRTPSGSQNEPNKEGSTSVATHTFSRGLWREWYRTEESTSHASNIRPPETNKPVGISVVLHSRGE